MAGGDNGGDARERPPPEELSRASLLAKLQAMGRKQGVTSNIVRFRRSRRKTGDASKSVPYMRLVLIGLAIGGLLGIAIFTPRLRRAEIASATAPPTTAPAIVSTAPLGPKPPSISPGAKENSDAAPAPLPRVTYATGGRQSTDDKNFSGVVERVIDGDTIDVAGAPARVRLAGIDAPELGTSEGERSRQVLNRLAAGRRVRCAVISYDMYGRVVATCRFSDGADLSRLMTARGAAQSDNYRR